MANQNETSAAGTTSAPGNKVWFITGTSRVLGCVWTEAALKRGGKVAANARKLASIADFKEKWGANVLTLVSMN